MMQCFLSSFREREYMSSALNIEDIVENSHFLPKRSNDRNYSDILYTVINEESFSVLLKGIVIPIQRQRVWFLLTTMTYNMM